MAGEWDISRATGKCARTGRSFVEGDHYYAVLFESPEGLNRVDYSEQGWEGPPEGCFCYWKGRIAVREKKPATITMDNEVLKSLFMQLEDESSETKQQFRFLLALLLMRKRLLKFEKTIRDGNNEYWVMKMSQGGGDHQVLNPRLTAEQTDGLNEKMIAILSGNVQAIESLDERTSEEGPPPDAAGAADAADTAEGNAESGEAVDPGVTEEAKDVGPDADETVTNGTDADETVADETVADETVPDEAVSDQAESDEINRESSRIRST